MSAFGLFLFDAGFPFPEKVRHPAEFVPASRAKPARTANNLGSVRCLHDPVQCAAQRDPDGRSPKANTRPPTPRVCVPTPFRFPSACQSPVLLLVIERLRTYLDTVIPCTDRRESSFHNGLDRNDL